QALNSLIVMPNQKNLGAAKSALRATHAALLQAEASIFYVDAGSSAEILSLQDPANLYGSNGKITTFDELNNLLDGYLAQRSSPENAQLIEKSMAIQAKMLAAGMGKFTQAWETEDKANFRNQFFIHNPTDAIVRTFQGLVIFTGIVLPRNIQGLDLEGLSTDRSLSAEEILGALSGIQDICMGGKTSENADSDPAGGLNALIEIQDPIIAKSIDDAIAHAMQIARQLAIEDDVKIRRSLLGALSDLTKQLKKAGSLLHESSASLALSQK
ncbi:MAG: hypothetical protein ABIP97_06360, partial [Chthoniobacterales bacterium]